VQAKFCEAVMVAEKKKFFALIETQKCNKYILH